MPWGSIGYAALCVFVPLVWGLVVYAVSTRIERRVLGKRPHGSEEEAESLPLEYHI